LTSLSIILGSGILVEDGSVPEGGCGQLHVGDLDRDLGLVLADAGQRPIGSPRTTTRGLNNNNMASKHTNYW